VPQVSHSARLLLFVNMLLGQAKHSRSDVAVGMAETYVPDVQSCQSRHPGHDRLHDPSLLPAGQKLIE